MLERTVVLALRGDCLLFLISWIISIAYCYFIVVSLSLLSISASNISSFLASRSFFWIILVSFMIISSFICYCCESRLTKNCSFLIFCASIMTCCSNLFSYARRRYFFSFLPICFWHFLDSSLMASASCFFLSCTICILILAPSFSDLFSFTSSLALYNSISLFSCLSLAKFSCSILFSIIRFAFCL